MSGSAFPILHSRHLSLSAALLQLFLKSSLKCRQRPNEAVADKKEQSVRPVIIKENILTDGVFQHFKPDLRIIHKWSIITSFSAPHASANAEPNVFITPAR